MVKNKILILLIITLLTGCDAFNELSSIGANASSDTVWTFTQFNVTEEGDTINSYYYYGEISKNLYQKISENQLSTGFILLRNVKYWGTDDLIYSYRSKETDGSLIFRIEDIHKMELVRTEPIVGKGQEQFEDEPKVEEESSVETAVNAESLAVTTEDDAMESIVQEPLSSQVTK
jgi:hypothetical protein